MFDSYEAGEQTSGRPRTEHLGTDAYMYTNFSKITKTLIIKGAFSSVTLNNFIGVYSVLFEDKFVTLTNDVVSRPPKCCSLANLHRHYVR